MKKTSFPLLFLVVMLTACSPGAISTSATDAQEAVSKMVYVKEPRSDLCFGIISSSSVNSSGNSTSMSVVNVPCNKVEKFLVTKP